MRTRNVTELYTHLTQIFDDLREGRIDSKQAVEMNNTAGKIFSGLKVQLAYHALRGEEPEIPFIAGETAIVSRTRVEHRLKAVSE